jgi:hypothetical protein
MRGLWGVTLPENFSRLQFPSRRHGAVSHRHLPVRVICLKGLHRADNLMPERRLDQVALARPNFEVDADKMPALAGYGVLPDQW